MKQRILLTLVTLFALLTGANAESPYGLQICGVDVTDENKGDLIAVITSVAGCSATGTMSYDSGSKTLTLDGVTADFGTRKGITSSLALTINLVGSNSLKSTESVIYTNLSDLTVQGSGSLVLESTNSHGIECNYGTEPAHTLTFKETNVEIKGYGLHTSGDIASKLVIDKSSLKASSIYTWGEIELKDVTIAKPLGAALDTSDWPSIKVNGENAENIEIIPDTRQDAELAWSVSSNIADVYDALESLPTLNNKHSLAVTYSSSDTDVATIDSDGKITIVGNGVLDESKLMRTNITATFAGNEEYKPQSVSCLLEIYQTQFDINKHKFDKDKYSVTLGSEFVEPQPQNPLGQTITYRSSDESVATVDANTGKVTVVNSGWTYIYADFAAKNVISEGSVAYRLLVTTDATVSFPKNAYTANLGTSFEAPKATVTPTGVEVKYASSDESVATVDASTGSVNILKVGETTISAAVVNTDIYGEATASYKLTVEGKKVEISFPKGEYKVRLGETFSAPKVQGAPEDATIKYTSGNAKLATVDEKTGEVHLLNVGTLSVFAHIVADDKYAGAEAKYLLDIAKGTAVISFSTNAATAIYGQEFKAPTLNNPDKLEVVYASSKPEVATVDTKTGSVTILAAGSTTISAKFSGDDLHSAAEVSYILTVNKGDATLAFSANEATATFGEAFTAPTLTNELKLSVVYSSSDEAVAIVNAETGAVTVLGAGKTTITAAFDGNNQYEAASTSYELTVNKSTSLLAFSSTAVTATYGQAFTTPILQNENKLEVVYTSSNEEVATVDNTGVVTILAAGKTTITATFAGNNQYEATSASYELTVNNAVPGLAWSVEKAEATIGEAFTAPTLTNEHQLAVTYTSSNEKVATIDAEGKVTIVGAGETTISAVFAGNKQYAAGSTSYTLVVSLAKVELAFSATEATATVGEAFTAPTLKNDLKLEVTYSSSDTKVATVDAKTGAVTILAAGKTTITAEFAGNEQYEATKASYELTVESETINKEEPVTVDGETLYKPSAEVAEAIKNSVANEIALSEEAAARLTVGADGSMTFAEGADVKMAILGVEAGKVVTFTFEGTVEAEGLTEPAASRRAALSLVSGKEYIAVGGDILLTLKTSEAPLTLSKVTVANATGIQLINADGTTAKRYNLRGQRVDESYKGIVIINGKKMLVK